MARSHNVDADVLVLGAGMAGLAAARSLAEQGYRVLVLEAQDRIGGRILTSRVGREIVELGAEFVHGRPPELLNLIDEAGLTLAERTGSFVRYSDGALITDDADDDSDSGGVFGLLDELENTSQQDLSFIEFLAEKQMPDDERDEAVGYVEGFNAADSRVISTRALGMQQKAEDAIEGDRSFHVEGGYDQLPAFLARKLEAQGGELCLDTRVDRLEWRPGRVIAHSNLGSFSAERAVIALPLGVLQSGEVAFEPHLPERVGEIFVRSGPIQVGRALRFTMVFRERFWSELPPQPEMNDLSFLIGRETTPSVWWTARPEAGNTLTGWVGGPRTELLAGLSAQALAERGCAALAKILGLEHAFVSGLLTGCFTHDWSADPHSQGAYSYIGKGGMDAPGVLARPVADTLYFAGEHTSTDGHWGTVHAALASGLRAARQISGRCKP